MTGSYDDTNALANITIAGWSTGSGYDGCSGVRIMAGGKSVYTGDVKITSGNGAIHVAGLENITKAFHANLTITFM